MLEHLKYAGSRENLALTLEQTDNPNMTVCEVLDHVNGDDGSESRIWFSYFTINAADLLAMYEIKDITELTALLAVSYQARAIRRGPRLRYMGLRPTLESKCATEVKKQVYLATHDLDTIVRDAQLKERLLYEVLSEAENLEMGGPPNRWTGLKDCPWDWYQHKPELEAHKINGVWGLYTRTGLSGWACVQVVFWDKTGVADIGVSFDRNTDVLNMGKRYSDCGSPIRKSTDFDVDTLKAGWSMNGFRPLCPACTRDE